MSIIDWLVLGGTLLAFARSVGEFGATLMVAGSIAGKTQTLSIAIYEAVQAGQDHRRAHLLAAAYEVLQRGHAGRIDQRHLAQAQDAEALPALYPGLRKLLNRRLDEICSCKQTQAILMVNTMVSWRFRCLSAVISK